MIKRIVNESRTICAFAMCGAMIALTGCDRPGSPVGERSEDVRPAASAIGRDKSDVSLKILDFAGLQQLIASQRGKVVVLDVWSTSCPPCIKSFPDLVALHRKIGSKRLACVSLSLDYEGIGKPKDVAPTVLAFLRQQNATFDNVLASEEPEIICKKLEITSPPTVLVYDAGGKMLAKFTAGASSKGKPVYEPVEELVTRLLAEK